MGEPGGTFFRRAKEPGETRGVEPQLHKGTGKGKRYRAEEKGVPFSLFFRVSLLLFGVLGHTRSLAALICICSLCSRGVALVPRLCQSFQQKQREQGTLAASSRGCAGCVLGQRGVPCSLLQRECSPRMLGFLQERTSNGAFRTTLEGRTSPGCAGALPKRHCNAIKKVSCTASFPHPVSCA